MPDPHYSFEIAGSEADDPVAMDPRLQYVLAGRRADTAEAADATGGKVAVIAKVTSPDRFGALNGVTLGVSVGDEAEDGTYIVTARVDIASLAEIRDDDTVVSLKAAQIVTPDLAATTAEIKARPADLPPGVDGSGVVVGVIDFGCAFAHGNFRNADGSTRLLKIWDQNEDAVFDRAEIDAALDTADPYQALGYGPVPGNANHGTHVLDIAAGNGRGSGVPGVAPKADLIFVDLASRDIPWAGPDRVGSSFGDSVQLLEALTFVFEEAGTRPCSVNVSLGTNGGPHDGTTLVEDGIDRLLTQAPNRSVCISASNSFRHGIHAAATVPAQDDLELPWNFRLGDRTENELELWYAGDQRLSVEVVMPSGHSLGLVRAGQRGQVVDGAGNVLVLVANRLNDPNNGDNVIGVFLSDAVPRGRWLVRLHNDGRDPVPFHAWIERDDAGQSSFEPPHDNTHTVGSISCGHKTIVVGSYDAHVQGTPLSDFSSSGPTRDGRPKPEVSAPGHQVSAADSRTTTGVAVKSGTSMASPAVAGAVALLLSAAKAQGRTLTVDEIRDHVLTTARTSPPVPGQVDPRYGHGRISARGMVGGVSLSVPADVA